MLEKHPADTFCRSLLSDRVSALSRTKNYRKEAHTLRLRIVLFSLLLLFTTSCHKESDNPVNSEQNTPTVTTTIAGIISDESGIGMSNTVVTAHGQTATTNESGLFVIRDVRVPETRCIVTVKKNGYFTASRAEIPRAGGVTHIRIGLMSNETKYSVEALVGGTVLLKEGGSVQLPANGFVMENGQPYTGTVKIAARWLNPKRDDFYYYLSGDYFALRNNSEKTELLTGGVLRVELSSESGAKIRLANGKKAQLTFPAEASQSTEMFPLWYFDENEGIWKEEGQVIRHPSGYTAEVSHFTDWQYGLPGMGVRWLRGTVHCNNESIAGAIVRTTVVQGPDNLYHNKEVVTDDNGAFQMLIIYECSLQLQMDQTKNRGIGSAPITIAPIPIGDTTVVSIQTTACPAYIQGTLTDCSNQSIGGIVQLRSPDEYSYSITRNGLFRTWIRANTTMTMDAYGFNGGYRVSQPVGPVANGNTLPLDSISLCPNSINTDYIDIPLANWYETGSLDIAKDGRSVAISNGYEAKIFDIQTGSEIKTITFPTLLFGTDRNVSVQLVGKKLLVWNWMAIGVWDIDEGTLLSSFIYDRENPDGAVFSAPHILSDNSTLSVMARLGSPPHTYSLRYLSIVTGEEIKRLDLSSICNNFPDTSAHTLRTDNDSVLYIFYQPTTQLPYVPGTIKKWKIQNNDFVLLNTTPLEAPTAIPPGVLIGNEQYLAGMSISASDRNINVYNISTNQLLASWRVENRSILQVGFCWNTMYAAVQTMAQETIFPITVYNLTSGEMITPLATPMDSHCSQLLFSEDGRSLAAYIQRREEQPIIRVWHFL